MSELYISKVKLANGGGEYVIKDAWAREQIAALGSPTHFIGVTTTALTDGATTNPIVIGGESVTAKSGDIVVYGKAEFIWDGAKWTEFGDLSTLGNLAKHDIADIVVTISETKDEVLGSGTTFTNAASTVSFAEGTGSNFVTGYDSEAVLPSFTEGAFSAGSLPSFTEGAFSAGTLPSFEEGAFNAGTLPTFEEGAFTPAEIQSGFVTPGSAATYSHSGFSGGSLGEATTGNFATAGVTAAMGTGNDAETLIFTAASTSAAVTAQGSFTPAVYGTDTFNGGTPTAIDVTKFDGGSKAADSFTAGTLPSRASATWSAGTLPSKAADTFSAGTLPSKAADTFSAGSAATLAVAKAITASDTATAAAQTITVGSNDLVNAVIGTSGSVSYSS